MTNRLLLWGVYGGASLCSQLAYITSIGMATTSAGDYPFFLDALMDTSSCSAAVALWLAFFPPRAYRSWLASEAPESAS